VKRSLFALVAAVACLSGCRTFSSDESEAKAGAEIVPTKEPAVDCVPEAKIDFARDRIEFQRRGEEVCNTATTNPIPGVTPAQTRMLVNGRPVCESLTPGQPAEAPDAAVPPGAPPVGLELDDARIRLGSRWYTVFVWPSDTEDLGNTWEQRYARLEELMTGYAKLVGTCLHRGAKGEGETDWLTGKRSTDGNLVARARATGDSKQWCATVRARYVEAYVRPGSSFCQYGNCGEGGHVGACLAKRLGFADEHIRLCSSKNDHMFAMVKDHTAGGDWCILDRWNIIGNYRCGVDLDTRNQQVIKRDAAGRWQFTGENWFQRAGCLTIDNYVGRGVNFR
jgi:hypothetical protein